MPKSRIEYMIQDSHIDCIVKNKYSRYDFKSKQILLNDFWKIKMKI